MRTLVPTAIAVLSFSAVVHAAPRPITTATNCLVTAFESGPQAGFSLGFVSNDPRGNHYSVDSKFILSCDSGSIEVVVGGRSDWYTLLTQSNNSLHLVKRFS